MTKSSLSKTDKKLAISLDIERYVNVNPDTSYLEACVYFANEYDIDVSDMKKFISESLKQKIRVEAVKNKTIKGSPDTVSLDEFV